MARLPSPSELADLPPARRRELIRTAFDTPLRARRLDRLRAAIRARQACLATLPRLGRETLELRAGLRGESPLSRRAIGRRIDRSPAYVLRLERRSLRRLLTASERGGCDGAAAAGGIAGADASNAGGATPGDGSGGDDGSGTGEALPASDVLADAQEDNSEIDLGDGSASAVEELLLFLLTLLVLLGPVGAAALIVQRRAEAPVAHDGERPLLFLDVGGVVALDLFSDAPRPGRVHGSPFGLSYVPDRVGPLVRELAERFDVVWATGWEHHANAGLVPLLGLREDLPVLTFGGAPRAGSSRWKVRRVADYAGHRPAAWLDDSFASRHVRWAAHRTAPTLLVPVDPRVGLGPDHVERLLRWADRTAPAARQRTSGARPARADRR